jgi:hypothetical protein
MLWNNDSNNWKDEFRYIYEHYLRGSKCVDFGVKVLLTYDRSVRLGYMLNNNINWTADVEMAVPFNFSMFIEDEKELIDTEALDPSTNSDVAQDVFGFVKDQGSAVKQAGSALEEAISKKLEINKLNKFGETKEDRDIRIKARIEKNKTKEKIAAKERKFALNKEMRIKEEKANVIPRPFTYNYVDTDGVLKDKWSNTVSGLGSPDPAFDASYTAYSREKKLTNLIKKEHQNGKEAKNEELKKIIEAPGYSLKGQFAFFKYVNNKYAEFAERTFGSEE